ELITQKNGIELRWMKIRLRGANHPGAKKDENKTFITPTYESLRMGYLNLILSEK
ncbi:24604_t:CDS:1, partial [Dentiscutata erythropus]